MEAKVLLGKCLLVELSTPLENPGKFLHTPPPSICVLHRAVGSCRVPRGTSESTPLPDRGKVPRSPRLSSCCSSCTCRHRRALRPSLKVLPERPPPSKIEINCRKLPKWDQRRRNFSSAPS